MPLIPTKTRLKPKYEEESRLKKAPFNNKWKPWKNVKKKNHNCSSWKSQTESAIPKKDKIEYTYQVNFTRSVHIIREFLRKKGGKNPPVEHLIAKEILPIRPGRKYKRHVKLKTVVYFNYRYN